MQHFPLTEKLHTDVLEERYGKIHAEVLKHNSRVRESLLVDSEGVARTYALTFINNLKDSEVKKINDNIRKGDAIGKAFRRSKYHIRKNVLDVFIIRLPKWLMDAFHIYEKFAKARLSEFYAKKKGKTPLIYGVVAEVYTPDFRKPRINEVDRMQIGAITECLEEEGFSKEEIYRRIGDDNNYEDVQSRYDLAKKKSKRIILNIRKKIEGEIKKRR